MLKLNDHELAAKVWWSDVDKLYFVFYRSLLLGVFKAQCFRTLFDVSVPIYLIASVHS